jgi:hypothetical protein
MKRLIIIALLTLTTAAWADTIAQANSVQGHKLRLTNERCAVVSGRSSQAGWGRAYAWEQTGTTLTGCGRLDGETVLVEWYIPPGTIDTRRYSVDSFTWAPGYGSR